MDNTSQDSSSQDNNQPPPPPSGAGGSGGASSVQDILDQVKSHLPLVIIGVGIVALLIIKK
jgi:hypothetical protein